MVFELIIFLFLFSQAQSQIPFLDIFTYQGLGASSACTRVANAASSIGCSAGNLGTMGILYRISTSSSIDSFLEISSSSSTSYVLAVPSSLISKANIDKLAANGNLKGIVILPDTKRVPAYSQDAPLLQGSNYTSYRWNPNGLDLLQNIYKFPIFEISSLNATASATLLQALQYNANNRYTTFPLYAMELQANMWSGSSTAATCLKRGFCSPIGDLSVWSTFSQNMASSDAKPIILVTAHFDANALVRDFAYGASSRASAAVILSIVEALSKASIQNSSSTLLFTLFNAESWGSAGSKRFVKDISNTFQCLADSSDYCPFNSPACGNPCMQDLDFQKINFNNIASIIEFDVGGLLYTTPPSPLNSSLPLYMHFDQVSPSLSALFTNASNSNVTFSSAKTSNGLPPSSAMSFLSRKNIPAVFISDYQSEFSNPYYNSQLDDGADFGDAQVAALCKVADTAAKALYSMAAGSAPPSEIAANCTNLFLYLDCLTRSMSCSLMRQFLPNHALPSTKLSAYSSVFSFLSRLSISYTPFFIHRVLTSLTGTKTGTTCNRDNECPSGSICIQSQCISSLTRFHDAYGTGLEMDYVTGSFTLRDSSLMDSWVESVWDHTRLRIFLQPGLGVQWVELSVSVAVNLLVFSVIYYWEKLASVLL